MARGKKAAQRLTPEEKLAQALVPMEEQPYKIPENWCWVRLLNVANLYNGDRGKNYPSKKDYQITGIPFINAGALVDGQLEPKEFNYISEEKYNALGAGKIQCGDILYCLRGSLGKSAIVEIEGNGAISSSLCILRCTKAIDNRFLFFLLNSDIIKKQQDSAENGSAQPNLSAASVIKYMVPLPSILEQQRIVDRIESIFAKLDEAKEKAQAVVDGFELRKSAILHKAFMGELTAKWREEHGVTLDRWTKSTFSDVVDEFKYGLSEKSDYGYDGIPVFRIPNVTDNGLSFDDLKYLSHSQIDSSSLLRKDDVLIIRSNGSKELVGKSVLVPSLDKEYTYASFLIRARLNPKIVPAYFVYYINSSDARIQMFKKAKSSAGINNINSKELGAINILVCSVSEQSEIVRILDEFLDKENASKEAAEAVLEQIDTMKKAVLARAFRGELGTNDPTEESAVELLKTML
jgi:type I restriction enzyme S subunit